MTIRVSKICKCRSFFADFEEKALVQRNVRAYFAEHKIPTASTDPKYLKEQETENKSIFKRFFHMFRKPNILEKGEACDPDGVFFGVPLQKLTMNTVHLKTGQVMAVPQILHELCVYVLQHAEKKGIFRKQGSGVKQEEIKAKIEMAHRLPAEDFDVIDIAVIIKYFLRQLPTPPIPEPYHDLFLACFDHPDREDLLLLACLLLPVDHLNLLTFLMQFLEAVAAKSAQNKMPFYNIAVCVAPNIMPVYKQDLVMKVVGITNVLIVRSDLIGMVPEFMARKEGWSEVQRRSICRRIFRCAGITSNCFSEKK